MRHALENAREIFAYFLDANQPLENKP
jgi:hypothetical protein